MDLTQLANLGEFIGGVAVLATLVYLAAQVRQGNAIVKSQVEHETSRRSSELLLALAENQSQFFRAIAQYSELSPDEKFQVTLRWLAFVNYYETLFYARERGEVEDDLWESRLARMRWAFAGLPREIWNERKEGFGHRFRAFIERKILPEAADPVLLRPS